MKKSHPTRFLSLILALVLSFSLCTPAFAAGTFSDVPTSHWAYAEIMECASQGIVTGFSDGSFQPNDPVSSAQFITMLTRTFYADELAAVQVPAGQPWYYASVKAAEDAKITTKLSAIDDTYMNRYEMAVALCNVINMKAVVLRVAAMLEYQYRQGQISEPPASDWNAQQEAAAIQAIQDWDSIPSQYSSAVAQCYALGALTGMADGSFSGDDTMTRAQACVVMTRMMDLIQGKLPSAPSTPSAPSAPAQDQQPEAPAETSNGTLANGQAATPENVNAMLEQLKTQYPEGMTWDTNTKYSNSTTEVHAAFALVKQGENSISNTVSACGGYAAMISDAIFGHNTGYEVTNIEDVRPGDLMFKFDKLRFNQHVMIVLYTLAPGAEGNANKDRWVVYVTDGNRSSKVCWSANIGIFGCGYENASPYDGIYYKFVSRY